MTEPVEPSTPDPAAGGARRIGDAERDKATEYLREHMAAGRLDAAEFDERLTRALNAKVGPDLDALFTDLPGSATRHGDGADRTVPGATVAV